MQLLYFFEKLRMPWLDSVMMVITQFGGEILFLAMAIGAFWCVSKRLGYYMLTVGFIGTTLNQALKLIFRISRPWVQDPDFTIVEAARADAGGYSFPSGHTQNAASVMLCPALMARKKWLKAVLWTMFFLVALSRMYLGVHTPLDVGVSLVIGLALVFVLRPLFNDPDLPARRMVPLMAALIVRARGAGDRIRMSELFSQTIIVCGLVGVGLTLIYVVFTPRLVRLVADDPAVYDNALAYFRAMRFYPLVDVFDTFMFAYVLYQGGYVHFYIAISARIGINAGLSWVLGSSVLPEAFDIDNEETFRLAGTKLMILAPSALFICLSRVTAIFYQYTRRIPRTIILFGTAIALLPSAFAMFFGRNAPEGIAVGIALGPVTALALIYGYVRFIKKETWRGSRW